MCANFRNTSVISQNHLNYLILVSRQCMNFKLMINHNSKRRLDRRLREVASVGQNMRR